MPTHDSRCTGYAIGCRAMLLHPFARACVDRAVHDTQVCIDMQCRCNGWSCSLLLVYVCTERCDGARMDTEHVAGSAGG